jgi:hypothetical protein
MTIKIQAKLGKKTQRAIADRIKQMDYHTLRPYTPAFNPSINTTYINNVRSSLLNNPQLPTCERLQVAMQEAATLLPPRTKPSAEWY